MSTANLFLTGNFLSYVHAINYAAFCQNHERLLNFERRSVC